MEQETGTAGILFMFYFTSSMPFAVYDNGLKQN